MIRYLFCKLTIFIEFRYPSSVFPGEAHVLPDIIVEICRGKTEKKKTKTINKTKQKTKNKKQKKPNNNNKKKDKTEGKQY